MDLMCLLISGENPAIFAFGGFRIIRTYYKIIIIIRYRLIIKPFKNTFIHY